MIVRGGDETLGLLRSPPWLHGLYALSFTAPGKPPVTVPYGQIASVDLAGQKWKASVVRSYAANAADYPAPYAWWFQGAE